MNDVAAHLVDKVFPEVPIRQWVCSLPWRLRTPVGYDRALCADVLKAFLNALTRSVRHRAKRALGLRSVEDALTGAVTFVQRADGALRLNVHFHTLALDGVYVRDEQGCLTFHALEPPSHQDVAQVAAWTHAGVVRVLHRHGRSLDGVVDETGSDSFHDDCPVLASCYAASAKDLQLLGTAPGNKTTKLVGPTLVRGPSPNDAVAEVGGVNVHAKVVVDGRDRKRLERLCRYVARPPLAQDRLDLRNDGRVRYRFKAPWKDGTSAILLDPLDFLARLCALVPPPKFHMLRYHGVLAPHAKVRSEVVPRTTPDEEEEPAQLPLFEARTSAPLEPPPAPSPSRHPWPWLLPRVFATDILTCPRCHGPMKLVTIATDKSDIDAVLRHTHPPRGPPIPLFPPFPRQLPLPFLDSGVA